MMAMLLISLKSLRFQESVFPSQGNSGLEHDGNAVTQL